MNNEWVRKYDEQSGYHYYLNKTTGESKWDESEYETINKQTINKQNDYGLSQIELMINDSYSLFSQPSMSLKNEMENEKYKETEKSSMTKSDQISLMYCLDTKSDIMRNIQREHKTKTEQHNKHFGFLDPLAPKTETISMPKQESVSKSKAMETVKDINYNMLKEIQKEKDKQEIENDELIANLLYNFDPYHEKKEQSDQPSNPPIPPKKPEYNFHETMYNEPLIQTDNLYEKDNTVTELIDCLIGFDKSKHHIFKQPSPSKQTKPRRPLPPPSYPPPERPSILNNPKSFFYLKPPKNPPNIMHSTTTPVKPNESPPQLPYKAKLLKDELQRHRENLQTLKKISEDINKEMYKSFKKEYSLVLDSPGSTSSMTASPASSSSASEAISETTSEATSAYASSSIYDGMDIHSPSHKQIICKKIVKSDSEIPIDPEGVIRQHGFLIGYLYIRVTTKRIMKKWSKRYFTLKDGILKLWKDKDYSTYKKSEREINLVNYERKVVDKNNSTKNLDKYILTDIKLHNKNFNMSYFDIIERSGDIKVSSNKIIMTIGSKNPNALKLLKDDMNVLIKF